MLSTSVLVALLLAAGPPTRATEAPPGAAKPFHLRLANDTAGDGLECPSVCPACPACPGAPPCPRHIPPGYEQHGALGFYKMHFEEKNWTEAKGACEREGGYLAVLNSQSEADLASSFMTKHGLTDYVHIGFFDVTKQGKYITVLGGPLSESGYAEWAPGEPTSVGIELCGSFKVGKGLNDEKCHGERPFLCELFT